MPALENEEEQIQSIILNFDKMKNYKFYFVHNNVSKILIKPIKAKLIMRYKYKMVLGINNNNCNNNNNNSKE